MWPRDYEEMIETWKSFTQWWDSSHALPLDIPYQVSYKPRPEGFRDLQSKLLKLTTFTSFQGSLSAKLVQHTSLNGDLESRQGVIHITSTYSTFVKLTKITSDKIDNEWFDVFYPMISLQRN